MIKKITYSIDISSEDNGDIDIEPGIERVTYTGTINVKKALKERTLAWIDMPEIMKRKIIMYCNFGNKYCSIDLDADLILNEKADGELVFKGCNPEDYSNEWEVDVVVEEREKDINLLIRKLNGVAVITIEE
jgi:hypothetical protein